MSDKKEDFIKRTVWETLEELRGRLDRDIRRKKLRLTDLLLDTVQGRGTDVFEYREENGVHRIRIRFPDYGRLLEIRYFQKRQYYETPDAKRSLYGIKPRRKRDTRWYSKNVYAWLAELNWQLRYGFKEEVNRIGQPAD